MSSPTNSLAIEAVDRAGPSGWMALGEQLGELQREPELGWGIPHAVGWRSASNAWARNITSSSSRIVHNLGVPNAMDDLPMLAV